MSIVIILITILLALAPFKSNLPNPFQPYAFIAPGQSIANIPASANVYYGYEWEYPYFYAQLVDTTHQLKYISVSGVGSFIASDYFIPLDMRLGDLVALVGLPQRVFGARSYPVAYLAWQCGLSVTTDGFQRYEPRSLFMRVRNIMVLKTNTCGLWK